MARQLQRRYIREDPEARRQELIEATFRCLERNGYARTGVRAIAEEAGVTIGLIRHHFSDKKQLIVETYRYVTTTLYQLSDQAAARAGTDPWARFHAFLLAGNAPPFLNHRYIKVRVILWGEAITDPDIRAIHNETYPRYRRRLQALIGDAVGPDVSTERLAVASRSVLAFLDGLWIDWILDAEPADIETSIGLCVNMVQAATRPPSGPKHRCLPITGQGAIATKPAR